MLPDCDEMPAVAANRRYAAVQARAPLLPLRAAAGVGAADRCCGAQVPLLSAKNASDSE